MANWLYGWKHRIPITIESSVVDSNLTWFPVLLKISTSSGRGSKDLSRIFRHLLDEKLKIAVTQSDGQTQLKVESVNWNAAGNSAELWVSRDGWTISASADTIIYLYFDNTHADNTSYVGVVGSTPGKAVWDANFAEVLHGKDGVDNAHITGSKTGTSYSKKGANEPQEVDGAQDFDGIDDEINLGTPAIFNVTRFLIEAYVYPDAVAVDKSIFGSHNTDVWLQRRISFRSNAMSVAAGPTYDTNAIEISGDALPAGAWIYTSGSWDRQNLAVRRNQSATWSSSLPAPVDIPAAASNRVGRFEPDGWYWDGKIKEFRFSDDLRTVAWQDATSYALADQLLTFGEFEDYPEENRGTIAVRCQEFGIVLTRDVCPDIEYAIGDGKLASEILTEILTHQAVERITLGGVDSSLDRIIAFSISGFPSLWEACKAVRDTIGGYLWLDPAADKLWIKASLGENKGQQIRLGKNLVGIEYTEDYIDYCNRLYLLGDSGLLLSTKTFSRKAGVTSSDATYGYLKLAERYGAYKDWTATGNACPANVTIEKPTGAWYSPIGGSGVDWVHVSWAYDNDLNSSATFNLQSYVWSQYLTLTCPPKTATQVKFPNQFTAYNSVFTPCRVQVDVESSGVWENVADVQIYQAGFLTAAFSSRTVTSVRFRAINTAEFSFGGGTLAVNEIYLWDSTGYADDTTNWKQGDDERTFRIPIASYVSGVGYVVSYTHAPYLIDLDNITARSQIFSKKVDLSAADVDILIDKGRTKLDELKLPIIRVDGVMVDLSIEEGREFEELQLGSTVRLLHESLGINYSTTVVRLSKPDLLHPERLTIEFGNKIPNILDVI